MYLFLDGHKTGGKLGLKHANQTDKCRKKASGTVCAFMLSMKE